MDSSCLDYVCCLHKAIYGLKQAPCALFNRLSQALIELGFIGSSVDTSLFMFHHHPIHLFVLVYVDDNIVTGTHSLAISTLFNKLQQDFAMKDLGSLSYFLSIQAVGDSTSLHLHQSKYILDLLHRSKMIGAKLYASPSISSNQLQI